MGAPWCTSSVCRNMRLRTKSMYCSIRMMSVAIRCSVSATLGGRFDTSMSPKSASAEILESVPSRGFGKLVEIEGLVDLLEMIVEEVRVGLVPERIELLPERHAVGTGGGRALRQEVEQPAGLLHLGDGARERRGVIDHHVADHPADVPAGKRVVAHVRDAVRREIVPADREDPFPHGGRHPRIDAVANDVVELAPRRVDVGDVVLAQLDVGKAEGPDLSLALLDLARRKIDADEAGIRQLQRHRDQVVAAGAAEFQHATGVDVGRLQSEKPGECREAVRVRLRKRLVDVRHFVVAGLGGVGHGSVFLA